MDNFELKTEPKAKRNPVIWNILTVIVLLGACGLAYLFLKIYQTPALVPASFQPVVIPTLYRTPTPTATIIPQPATWTPTLTTTPFPTRTKAPTWTSVAMVITPSATLVPTNTPIVDTATITATAMPAVADITYQSSTTKHPGLGCNWMGIGGTVMDVNSKPLVAQTIQLGGTLNGKAVTGLVLSGQDTAYGTSGFEIKLADSAADSTQTLWVQLFDNKGNALTEKTYFDTFKDCQKNLVMFVFTLMR